MFLRRNRPRQDVNARPIEQQQQRQSKLRKPNKNLQAALDADVMRDEYFLNPTAEEATEVTRILEAKNHFEVLELDHKDDLDEKEDELRQSYLRKVMLLNSHISNHPRMTEAFTKLSQAYDVLSDPILRLEHKYDQYGGRPQAADPFAAMLQSMFDDDMGMMPPMGLFAPMRRDTQQRQPRQVLIRRPQRDPLFGMMEAMFGGLEGPQPQPARRGSNDSSDSSESEIDDIARDFARLMFGPIPAVSPAERRRREREEQRRLRIENQRRRQELERQRQAEEQEDNESIGIDDIMRLMFGGAPRQERQRQRQGVTVIGPGNIRFVHRTASGTQPPVVRARPVDTPAARPAPAQQAQARPQLRRQGTNELEQNLQTLMGMGFSEEDSLRALDFANGNVEHAITLLLN